MKFLTTLILGMLFALNAYAGAPNGSDPDGLPLPWPFPWAKDCPVDWERLDGRYFLSDSSQSQQIELKITVVSNFEFSMVGLARYSSDGAMISEGFSWVPTGERFINIKLIPKVRGEDSVDALLKLHYFNDNDLRCSDDNLVPILTLDRESSSHHTKSHYRLVRVTPTQY